MAQIKFKKYGGLWLSNAHGVLFSWSCSMYIALGAGAGVMLMVAHGLSVCSYVPYLPLRFKREVVPLRWMRWEG